MHPIRLNLHNFLSYRDETVELDAIHMAALIGENGSGKSSLLDGIVWCLYGQGTKGGIRELDNYVTRGETECRVELDFRLAGQTYRVIRGRSIKGKSILEFYVQNGADWRPLSGKTVGETQAAIDAALRMDYRSLTASALTLQGQADALTADMTDAERKEVLARILGLDLWDRMQERVREKIRGLKAELAAVEQTKQRLLQCASEKPALEVRRAEVVEQLSTKAAEIERVTAEVAELEAQVRQRPMLEQTLGEVNRGIQKADETLRQIAGEISKAQQQISEAEQVIKRNEALLARRSEIEAAAEMEAEIAADVAEMDRKAQEYMRLSREAAELERQAATWDRSNEAEVARTEAAIEVTRRQAGTMDQVPCAGDVKSACPLLAGAKQAAAELQRLHDRLRALKQAINPHIDRWQAVVQARDAIGYDPGAHQAARAALADIRKTSGLKAELAAAAALTQSMTEKIAAAQETIASATTRRAEVEAEKAQLLQRHAVTRDSLNELIPAATALAGRQATLSSVRQQEAALRTELGRLDASLEQVARAEAELAALEEQTKAQRDKLAVYELLDQACGKKAGVPALIVENAVPEIERLANEMLAKMAGGRLAVRLDTQAEGKTGTMQEVLRITVLDGGVERPYQTYSGAERFMVDLALRVALSKFLAHRAGASINLFVLDEGVGCADAANRQTIMEALEQVGREFGKLICITHIEELKDQFPQRIEVTKGPDGSRVKVVA